MTTMTRTCHGRLTPHPMVSTAVIHVFVWRVITRITPNVDAQAGVAGCGQRADEALRYQVHVRSPSRERLAVIRLSRWFFADTPPPCIGQYRGADASALYGREADGRERKKAATHHTPRHEGKQGRAGQSSTRKTLKKSCKCRRGCDLVWWLGTGSPCGGDPVGGEDVRLRSVVKPGRKSGLDCGHFW